jgi:hypothetical protein
VVVVVVVEVEAASITLILTVAVAVGGGYGVGDGVNKHSSLVTLKSLYSKDYQRHSLRIGPTVE